MNQFIEKKKNAKAGYNFIETDYNYMQHYLNNKKRSS